MLPVFGGLVAWRRARTKFSLSHQLRWLRLITDEFQACSVEDTIERRHVDGGFDSLGRQLARPAGADQRLVAAYS
jgi:hypothetical protein